jgi:hypothetical protein
MFELGFGVDDVKRAVWTAVQAFLAAFIVLAPGIWTAPNLEGAKAAGLAALTAGIAAGLSALKNYILAPAAK